MGHWLEKYRSEKQGNTGKTNDPRPDWISAWKDVVQCTWVLEKRDPRNEQVMNLVKQCDHAFESGSWWNFQKASSALKGIMGHRDT